VIGEAAQQAIDSACAVGVGMTWKLQSWVKSVPVHLSWRERHQRNQQVVVKIREIRSSVVLE